MRLVKNLGIDMLLLNENKSLGHVANDDDDDQ